MANKKGILIVIDGTDGSGKATQINLLKERLEKNNFSVVVFDFPRYGEKSADMVAEYLNGNFGTAEEVGPYRASILYAVDRYAASFDMEKALAEGKIILCNRYVSASMGHQAGKIRDKIEREEFLSWLQNLEYEIFQIPKPNLNILLYVPPEMNQKLIDTKAVRSYTDKKRDIHENDLQHLKDAAQAFLYVAKKFNWTVIDCIEEGKLRTIPKIHELIWEKTKPILKNRN